jgi:hypothetical protein
VHFFSDRAKYSITFPLDSSHNHGGMNRWRRLRSLLVYLAPEPALVSPRKYIAILAALLAVAAIAGAVVLTPSHRSKPDVWENLQQSVSKRAQVDLFDDFSAGLDAWEAGANQASTWSYDKNGFVSVGALSLFEPSLPLTNYDLDALVQIEAKGLGLVFRAASSQSYQAARLIVEGSGPMPSLALQRYAVIANRPSRSVLTKYPTRFQADTLYRVHLEVRGDTFALYIQDNLIDSWSDARLHSGGVGLFCSPGEKARVAWVRVSHNTDTVGRMCSWLSLVLQPGSGSGLQ